MQGSPWDSLQEGQKEPGVQMKTEAEKEIRSVVTTCKPCKLISFGCFGAGQKKRKKVSV